MLKYENVVREKENSRGLMKMRMKIRVRGYKERIMKRKSRKKRGRKREGKEKGKRTRGEKKRIFWATTPFLGF